jgi:hypothetical protein
MKMILILIIVVSLFSCSNSKKDQSIEPNPLWVELAEELKLQFGQRVRINEQIEAVVIDVTKDEGGIWYGLCYLNNNKLFGRQIPNGIIFTTCVDMLDATYLNESGINLINKLELIGLSNTSIRIGSESPATTMEDLIRSYKFGLERRKLKQTPFDEDIFGLNPVRECYLDLTKYKKCAVRDICSEAR